MSKKLDRNGSFRLSDYDYGRNGFYFVTICVKPRENRFGNIVQYEMEYTHFGKIAKTLWEQIPKHFPFVLLDEFIVMPDHIHGIIVIDKTHELTYPVGAHNYARLQKRPILYKNKFGPQSKNLGSIIRAYKIAVKTYANHHHIPFAWQPRYYDRIIRNERELNNVRRYIRNNPKMCHNQ